MFLPNAQAQPADRLARIVPPRSGDKARFVTSGRLGCSVLLGLFFVFFSWFSNPAGHLPIESQIVLGCAFLLMICCLILIFIGSNF